MAVADRVTRVLVVDDMHEVADMVVQLLKMWGCEARAAYSGPSALVMAADLRPDIALVDLVMPDMDGFEVARRLRAQPMFEHVVIAAITGELGAEMEARTAAAGFDGHFKKPLDLAALRAFIEAFG
jgi:two-component system CheB/CheR fusion protein